MKYLKYFLKNFHYTDILTKKIELYTFNNVLLNIYCYTTTSIDTSIDY